MAENTLFPDEVGKMDSPRLAWRKKHNINVAEYPGENEDPNEKFYAFFGEDPFDHLGRFGDGGFGWGAMEDDALADLAEKFRLPTWNEETNSETPEVRRG